MGASWADRCEVAKAELKTTDDAPRQAFEYIRAACTNGAHGTTGRDRDELDGAKERHDVGDAIIAWASVRPKTRGAVLTDWVKEHSSTPSAFSSN